MRFEFPYLVQILINAKKFQLAFHFCKFKKDCQSTENIFLKYVENVISKNSNSQKSANLIITTFRIIKQNISEFDNSLLIKAANMALDKNQKQIAELLLKEENNIIQKIKTYLKMKNYKMAINAALKGKNTNAIYLIFHQMFKNNLNDYQSKIGLILDFKNQSLNEHFYKFLQIQQKVIFRKFTSSLKSPIEFYLKNNLKDSFDFSTQTIIQTQLGLLEECQILNKQQKSKFIFQHIQNYYECANKQSLQDKTYYDNEKIVNLNASKILQIYFEKEKSKFLDPNHEPDQEITSIMNKLKINARVFTLERVRFMLKHLQDQQKVIQYINKKKSENLKLLQLQLLFQDNKEMFLSLLETFPYQETFDKLKRRKMFYEAAWISIYHKNKEKFLEIFPFVSSKKQKQNLKAKTPKSFFNQFNYK